MRFMHLFLVTALALSAGVQPSNDPAQAAIQKGVQWLLSVQGKDGGWGQDGGETSYVRATERLQSTGNDVANTAVAALALIRAGNTSDPAVARALDFVLRHVEQSPQQGLAVTGIQGTQIQSKLGPYIDTFLTSMLLAELDGKAGDARSNDRVRAALQKCVAKIQQNQHSDGSWNLAGGWAPILGTSLASRSLYVAQQKGVKVDRSVLARVDDYTKEAGKSAPARAGAIGGAAAGVPLYRGAQALEQLSRTEADRVKNAEEIRSITREMSSPRFVNGFGSMGGEEFFSYLNISDSLKRTGGHEWNGWNRQIKARLTTLQNQDGSWAGHHCITGRVAVTSAALLTLLAEK